MSDTVAVDTMVQPGAVEHPTDESPFLKVLHHLFRVTDERRMQPRKGPRDLAMTSSLKTRPRILWGPLKIPYPFSSGVGRS